MKRFFTTAFIVLALTFSTIGVSRVAHAQFCDISNNCTYTTQAAADAASTQLNASNELGTAAQQTAAGLGTPEQQAAAAAQKTVTDPTAPPDTGGMLGSVMTWIASLFAWLVGVAALALDYAVYYTVINMGSYVHNLTAIGVTWRILRDIGNIALIFGFLAIGISIILNTERLGYGKKMLPMLLVAAVFLNFSLFFSEAVIDVGNLFATQFYTQINGGHQLTTNSSGLIVGPDGSTLGTGNEGISNKLLAQLGLQTLYNNARLQPTLLTGSNPWYVGFMGIILFIVTAFVMFSLAFILVARFVMLVFLIILAPVGFAGLAIPQLKKRAGQWWDTLFEQTITAPVLLLVLYVALAVITDAKFLTGLGGGSADAATGFIENTNLPGFGSYLMSFMIAIGLMLAVTMSAKRLSAFGSGWATKTAGALSFGAVALATRRTAGAGSQYLAKKVRSSSIASTTRGRLIASTLDKGAKASFDMRGIAAGGGLKGMGIDEGSPAKGGYKGDVEKSIKGHEEYAKTLTERKKTKEETEALAAAEAKKKEAEQAHKEVEARHATVTQQVAAQRAEIARLEEEQKKDKYWDTDPANVARLSLARQNLSSGEAALGDAGKKLAEAEANKTAAVKAHTEKSAEIEKAVSAKTAKEAYAAMVGNRLINKSPLLRGVMAYGGAGAVKKIKDAAKDKTDAEKVLEAVKAAAKKEAEDELKKAPGGGGDTGPAPAPAAHH